MRLWVRIMVSWSDVWILVLVLKVEWICISSTATWVRRRVLKVWKACWSTTSSLSAIIEVSLKRVAPMTSTTLRIFLSISTILLESLITASTYHLSLLQSPSSVSWKRMRSWLLLSLISSHLLLMRKVTFDSFLVVANQLLPFWDDLFDFTALRLI